MDRPGTSAAVDFGEFRGSGPDFEALEIGRPGAPGRAFGLDPDASGGQGVGEP